MQEHEYESYYLRDFIYFALRGWRKIIVFAIIGAVLLGGVALYRNRSQTTTAPTAPTPIEKDDEEAILTDEELKSVHAEVVAKDITVLRYDKRMEFLRSRIDVLAERLSNSVYLAIDGNNQPLAVFELVVSMDNVTGETEDIIEQRQLLLSLDYLGAARSNAFFTYLEREKNALISGTNLRELVDISMQEGNTIRFEITGPDMETVRSMSEAAQKFISQEMENQATYSYPHGLTIENESYRTVRNPAIAEERQSLEMRLEDSTAELEEIEKDYRGYGVTLDEKLELAEEQARIDKAERLTEEKIREAEAAAEEGVEGATASASVPFYAVGGFIVGILVALLWNFYRGASGGKLMHPDDFANRIGLLYINEIIVPAPEDKKESKRFGSGLDRWIERLYLRPKLRNAKPTQDSVIYAAKVIQGLNEAKTTHAACDLPDIAGLVNSEAETSTDKVADSVIDHANSSATTDSSEAQTQPENIAQTMADGIALTKADREAQTKTERNAKYKADSDAQTKTDCTSPAIIAVLTADTPANMETIAALNKEAARNDIPEFELLPVGSISNDISSIDKLREADSVLVLTRSRKTELQDLVRSLEMTQQLKKPVLGLISIEQID